MFFTWIYSGDIVRIINGPNYDEAAEVLRYLVPVLFFSFPGMLIGWPVLGAIDKASDKSELMPVLDNGEIGKVKIADKNEIIS